MTNLQNETRVVGRVTAPFAWYGGKQNLSPWLIERFPDHQRYVEPFAGAGNVLFAKPPSVFEVYNDLDDRVVNFYRVVRDPELFSRLRLALEMTPHAREEFAAVVNEPLVDDPVEAARGFFVCMRQARGGLGMSGITERGWAVSTRCRRKMPEAVSKFLSSIDGLEQVHNRLREVTIECRPAVEIIRAYDGRDAFHYLDPTYLPETRHGKKAKTYAHEMTRDDHVALLELINQVKGKVMISGYPADLYDSMLAGWRRDEYLTKAHVANSGGKRTEVIWMNY